jgi:hypothetical protein
MLHRTAGGACAALTMLALHRQSRASSAPPPPPPPPAAAPPLSSSFAASLRAPAVARRADGSVALNPAIAAVACVAALAVPAVLWLAARAARRAERVDAVIAAVERAAAASALVRTHVPGLRLYASGAYVLDVSATAAAGHVLLSTAPGGVRGVAKLAAARPHARAPWAFNALTLEVDKTALDAWRAHVAAAALARYGAEAVAAAAAASPPPPLLAVAPGAADDADGQVLTLVLA